MHLHLFRWQAVEKEQVSAVYFFANVPVVPRLVLRPESFDELNRREILDGFPCGCCCAEPSPSNE
jgi:hypothetical protein